MKKEIKDNFLKDIKENKFEIIQKETKLLLLNRINMNENKINPDAEKLDNLVGKQCVLLNDLYVVEYPKINNLYEEFITEDFSEPPSMCGKFMFVDSILIFTSNIKKVRRTKEIINVITRNTFYKFEIMD